MIEHSYSLWLPRKGTPFVILHTYAQPNETKYSNRTEANNKAILNSHPIMKIYFQIIFEFTWYVSSAFIVRPRFHYSIFKCLPFHITLFFDYFQPFPLLRFQTPSFSNVFVFISLRFLTILNHFHYFVFAKRAWHKNEGVSIVPFPFVIISFILTFPLLCVFGAKSVVVVVVVAFSTNSVFRVSIENDAFSNVTVFISLYFEQRFPMSPLSIISNGNINLKTETFTKTE